MKAPTLVWIRNDLRLHDNPAIFEAVLRGGPVVLFYVFDENFQSELVPGGASRVWLEHSLEAFGREAKRRGFVWLIREGNPVDIIKALTLESKATHLYWNRRYEPEGVRADKEIEEVLGQEGMIIHTFRGNLIAEPWQLTNKKGKPFQVFTPFWQAFKNAALDTSEAPSSYPEAPCMESLHSLSVQELPLTPKLLSWPKSLASHWQPGEEAALARLEQFCENCLFKYQQERDIPAALSSSFLSAHLHFGEISARRVWNMVLAQERKLMGSKMISCEPFLRQLAWREFAYSVLFHFPQTVQGPFRKEFLHVPWRSDEKESKAWKEGKTGFPIVDAGMRQLWQEGFLPNRVRMITASFLIKYLVHPWQEGMLWYADTLVDADLANNTFGWQWVAGCGVDAAPSFHIFNPVLQGEKFDPEGEYVKKYVPELKKVPPEYIHKPWKATSQDLRSWGIVLGKTYPRPIVDLALARARAVKIFSTPRS
jgi:deoxyribodipyrimidine photo-lyase